MSNTKRTFTYEEIDEALEKIGLRLSISAIRRNEEYNYSISTDYRVGCLAHASFLEKTGSSTLGSSSSVSFDDALEKFIKECSEKDIVIQDTRNKNQWDYAYRFSPEKGRFVERKLAPDEKAIDYY